MQMIGRLQAKFLHYGAKCGAARLCAALVLFVVLTQLLHLAGQVPLIFPNQRAPDFGYGHYNGFAGRLFGLYTAALLLLYRRFAPWGWALMAAVPAAVYLLTTLGMRRSCRAASVSWAARRWM